MAVTMPLAGRLYNRWGPRLLVGVGMVVSGFSFWQLSRLNLGVGFWDIFLPQALQGVGFGLVFVSLTTSAMLSIEKSRMTGATGLYVVVRQICGSIGIALVATLLTRGQTQSHAVLAGHLSPYRDLVGRWLALSTEAFAANGASHGLASAKALGLLASATARQAAMLAFNRIFFLLALLFFLSFPLVFLLQTGKRR